MRLLVLYVDRDGDLKTHGIDTPVVGRDEVLRAGIKYILMNPDDSDANAIFAAVKTYDKLVSEYGEGNINVAIVSGSPDPALADLTVVKELEEVLALFDADAIYFISDGPTDEMSVHAIRMKRPVIAVYRVVVKQARGVEETVTLFKYYFDKAIREPQYRRYTVGVPALLAFVILLSSMANLEIVKILINMTFLFISFFLVLYGFGIYDFLRNVLRKFEITFVITLFSLFAIVYHIVFTIVGSSILPDYLTVIVATLPFVSYVAESYVRTKSVRYGGIVAGSIASSFFYFIFPKITKPIIDIFELMFSIVQFISIVLIITILVYLLRGRWRRAELK